MTSPPIDAPPIDFDHLARQTFADRVLERDVLEMFARQCEALPPLVGAAERIREGLMAAHTLKGSARAVGAWLLAARADEAEALLQNGDTAGLAGLMDELTAAADAARIAALRRRGVP